MTMLVRDTGDLARKAAGVAPWVGGAIVLLYAMGYVDGSVHAAAFVGDSGAVMNYVHEFFHHARHVALMCH
ncbi:MAG: hypothetical protein F4Y49_02310 [Dehalococcoidia bacterium]|nr:hypothetical protein [Dehalococcoidia bacterium]